MERAEIQQKLRDGIAAIRAGDRVTGRDLLLQVVQADEGMEPAWLWLAEAVDNPHDQLIALENALALNPHQPNIKPRMAALRRELGAVATPRPMNPVKPAAPSLWDEPRTPWEGALRPSPGGHPADPDPAPAAPPPFLPSPNLPSGLDIEDDPYQCVYCGTATDPHETRCPNCRRGLMAAGTWRNDGAMYVMLLSMGLHWQGAILEAGLTYARDYLPTVLRESSFNAMTVNDPLAAALRVVLWGFVALTLVSEIHFAYALTLLAAVIDLVWAGIGYQTGWVSPLFAAINAGGAGLMLVFGLFALVNQVAAQKRVKAALDKNVSGGPMLYRSGQHHARAGRWALAALHFRKAIARDPRHPDYYKALGRAQFKLKRYRQAIQALQSGAEYAPNDPEFQRLMAAVRAEARIS
jgi:tetratricopeptide (TPR) repeat protein